jgi:endonuclease-3
MAKKQVIKFKVDKKTAAERVKKISPILKKLYPDAGVALRFTNPFELLIATILSAQCTDKRVNMITPALFAKYNGPTPSSKQSKTTFAARVFIIIRP